ncbi:MAG: UV DNA damage repair endonuclease UvsE [Candidatus Aureabacteria bacterium]|nr:UV DNA damage repair endonuclease UvsE [Candidatus Auribacterota bacterium]
MRIGYPCLNLSLGCTSSSTFRLRSFTTDLLRSKVESNLDCLLKILRYNVAHMILFFRVTSDLIPFASHPICRFKWRSVFKERFEEIGSFIRENRIRISMHPDQFTLINSIDRGVFTRSVRELRYHTDLLDIMGLDQTAKVQIHVGGVYGNRGKSIERFIRRHQTLDERIASRLVIENDDRNFPVADCLRISRGTGIPVVLDIFHHHLNNRGEFLCETMPLVFKTWTERDGVPIVDYSSQQRGARRGAHAQSLSPAAFGTFLRLSKPHNFDIMIEIKDKERSASKAIKAARRDMRFLNIRNP